MTEAGNWIAMARDAREHPIVGAGKPVKPHDPTRGAWSRFEAWHDLCCLAQWKPSRVNNKGEVQTLEAGQLMAARGYLASRWNWTEKTVRGFLDRLQAEGMILRSADTLTKEGQQKGRRTGNKCGVVTLCNYERYQAMHDAIAHGMGQAPGPAKGQRGASKGPQLNKETNKQNLDTCGEAAPAASTKAESARSEFEAFWQAFPSERRRDKGKARDLFVSIVSGRHRRLKATAGQIVDAVRRGCGIDPACPPMPTTWLNGSRWEDDPHGASRAGLPAQVLPADRQRKYLAEIVAADGPWDQRRYGANPHSPDCVFTDVCLAELKDLFDARGVRRARRQPAFNLPLTIATANGAEMHGRAH